MFNKKYELMQQPKSEFQVLTQNLSGSPN
jgi:hypothetical protein